MIGLSLYLAMAAGVVVLGYLAGRERHQRKDGIDIFRYPRVFPRAILPFVIALPILGAIVVYETFRAKPRGGALVLYFGIWGLFLVVFLLGYWYTQRFEIRVDGEQVSVRGIRTRTFAAGEIRRFVLVQGGSGTNVMSLYAAGNVKLLAAASTIQDFKDLVRRLGGLAGRNGVVCERRDKWGKWTKESLLVSPADAGNEAPDSQ